MARRDQGLRRVALLCLSLALLMLASVGDVLAVGLAPVAHAASGGVASACGDAPQTSITDAGGASLTLGHTSGPPGMTQTVAGAGWPAGAQISLDLDLPLTSGSGEGAMLQGSVASANVAPDGTFSMPGFLVPIPAGCDGGGIGLQVDFVAHTPDGKYVASAAFTYTAQPAVSFGSSTPIPAGATLQMLGSAWEANEAITLTVSVAPPNVQVGSAAPPPATTQPLPDGTVTTHADAQGQFNAIYALPPTLVPRSTLLVQTTGKGPLYGTVTAPLLQTAVLPAVMPTIALNRTSGTVTDAITVRGTHWYPGDSVNVTYCRGQAIQPGENALRCQPEVSETLAVVTVDASGGFTSSVHLPSDAQTGDITIQALVPNDIFGLSVYAQDAPYTIVPPPLPWDRVHPRLAFALSILKPALPALAIALLLLAAYLWNRLRHRRVRQPAVPAAVLDTHAPTGTPSTP